MNAPSPMAKVYSTLASQGVLVALVVFIWLVVRWLRRRRREPLTT